MACIMGQSLPKHQLSQRHLVLVDFQVLSRGGSRFPSAPGWNIVLLESWFMIGNAMRDMPGRLGHPGLRAVGHLLDFGLRSAWDFRES